MREGNYIPANGETYSPFVDDTSLKLKVSELLAAQERTGESRSRIFSSDVDFLNSLTSVGSQSIASATLFNLPPQNLPGDSEPEEDIWQAFERVLSQFPNDALSDLPKDLSINHDHYLYGTPKKS